MPRVTYVQADGSSQTLELSTGKSLMLAAQSHGVAGILGECGGQAMCATCHVYVEESYLGRLPEMTEDEDAMLEEAVSPRKPNSRLSCQVELTDDLDGLVLRLPEEQL
jgi:2Fe-2S ferredoxin